MVFAVAVHSHPTIGSIGLTEPEAEEKYGKDDIKIYKTSVSLPATCQPVLFYLGQRYLNLYTSPNLYTVQGHVECYDRR